MGDDVPTSLSLVLRRYPRPCAAHNTTLVIRASEQFLKKTFLPQFDQMVDTLHEHLDEVTKRVVAEVVHSDMSDAPVVDSQPQQLEAFPSADSRSNE